MFLCVGPDEMRQILRRKGINLLDYAPGMFQGEPGDQE